MGGARAEAQKAGVKPETVKDDPGRARAEVGAEGRRARSRFRQELYKTRRVATRTYERLHGLFGDAGMVELVGILGYYALISMTLNVFRAEIPADMPLPFKEPA